jgi:hypothetical protein
MCRIRQRWTTGTWGGCGSTDWKFQDTASRASRSRSSLMQLRFIIFKFVSRVHRSPLEGHCPSIDSILCALVRRARWLHRLTGLGGAKSRLATCTGAHAHGVRPGCRCVPACWTLKVAAAAACGGKTSGVCSFVCSLRGPSLLVYQSWANQRLS